LPEAAPVENNLLSGLCEGMFILTVALPFTVTAEPGLRRYLSDKRKRLLPQTLW